MIARSLTVLALVLSVSGCVTITDSENITVQSPPEVRLTDWMYQHSHYHNPHRVCYREVINNRGYSVTREMNCQGRILRETRRRNRY